MVMTALISISLSIIWLLTGELGFYICLIRTNKPENANMASKKNKFRIAGPFGLIYSFIYNTNKE